MTASTLLAASLLGPLSPLYEMPWWYYDTETHACAQGVSPVDMMKWIEGIGQKPSLRYDGKRVLVMKDAGDTQGLIFYRTKADCEADGRT
jgi:hypothetical protein